MTIAVQPGLSFERLPDGGVQIDTPNKTFMLTASEWTAMLARLISAVPRGTTCPPDPLAAREWLWKKAQAFHGVACFDECPAFNED